MGVSVYDTHSVVCVRVCVCAVCALAAAARTGALTEPPADDRTNKITGQG